VRVRVHVRERVMQMFLHTRVRVGAIVKTSSRERARS